jgi:dolichol-phosphate mannosyltransferase
MSGFFVLGRRFLDEVVYRASGVGFKILVDLLASAQRPVRVGEVPYSFRQREQGESKLDLNVGLDYLYLLTDKLAGQWIPVRFVLYSGVGAVGVLMHLGVLRGALNAAMPFRQAQTLATGLAMTGNFLLNNLVTYRDLRLKGWRMLPGVLTFYLACSVGFFTNLSVSETLVEKGLAVGLGGSGRTRHQLDVELRRHQRNHVATPSRRYSKKRIVELTFHLPQSAVQTRQDTL